MADENLVRNLFGDLVQMRSEGRGRPEHVWSRENSNKVLLAFALGWSVKRAAKVIGISSPTLRKVYFSEVAARAEAADRLDMTQLGRLNTQAEAGNVSAEKELMKQIEKRQVRELGQHFDGAPARRAKRTTTEEVPQRPRGKKEEAAMAAKSAGAGTDWGEDLLPGTHLVN